MNNLQELAAAWQQYGASHYQSKPLRLPAFAVHHTFYVKSSQDGNTHRVVADSVEELQAKILALQPFGISYDPRHRNGGTYERIVFAVKDKEMAHHVLLTLGKEWGCAKKDIMVLHDGRGGFALTAKGPFAGMAIQDVHHALGYWRPAHFVPADGRIATMHQHRYDVALREEVLRWRRMDTIQLQEFLLRNGGLDRHIRDIQDALGFEDPIRELRSNPDVMAHLHEHALTQTFPELHLDVITMNPRVPVPETWVGPQAQSIQLLPIGGRQ